MRHSAIRNGRRLIWNTQSLWDQARGLERFELEAESVPKLDRDCWFDNEKPPTLRRVAEHCRRILESTKEFPVILNDDGSLMDGGHRLCRALIEGKTTVTAVQFKVMPMPDKNLPA